MDCGSSCKSFRTIYSRRNKRNWVWWNAAFFSQKNKKWIIKILDGGTRQITAWVMDKFFKSYPQVSLQQLLIFFIRENLFDTLYWKVSKHFSPRILYHKSSSRFFNPDNLVFHDEIENCFFLLLAFLTEDFLQENSFLANKNTQKK